jgi:hypothetical protein
VQRTFALNDESALVICDYATAPRPRIPFPYFAEVMTGFEYTAATHMLYEGMTTEGLECIQNIRMRYDGERRNPWDEAECGHHYARAMAAWSGVLAMSGFRYHGAQGHVSVMPNTSLREFRCFWSNATGWGVFTRTEGNPVQVRLTVHSGVLLFESCEIKAGSSKSRAVYRGNPVSHRLEATNSGVSFRFEQPVRVQEGEEFVMEVSA